MRDLHGGKSHKLVLAIDFYLLVNFICLPLIMCESCELTICAMYVETMWLSYGSIICVVWLFLYGSILCGVCDDIIYSLSIFLITHYYAKVCALSATLHSQVACKIEGGLILLI